MTPEEIKKKVLAYGDWEFWLDRHYKVFVSSLFRGTARSYSQKIGVDAEWGAMLFQDGVWYQSKKVLDNYDRELENNLKQGATVSKVVKSCEQFYSEQKVKLLEIVSDDKTDPIVLLKKTSEIFYGIFPYVWLAHGFEHLYLKKMREEVSKHYKGGTDKLIGDISFPSKKNQHVYFYEALAGEEDLKLVQEKFAWIKCRDGFSEGYTIEELKEERERIRKEGFHEEFNRPEVPQPLRELASIAQDLVYLRTLRTDILYNFLYLARPLLRRVAEHYKLTFDEMSLCDIVDLIDGNPKVYSEHFTMAAIGGELAIFNNPILKDKLNLSGEVKGTIAYKGVERGIAKVIMHAHEIGKVKDGDIIIAPTTAPSYIIGMSKAVAFVTDEGGLTSHAAIVSREMKKPCIIGTKNATRVLKDGDFIEVNANEGIVKIIKST